MSLILLFFSFFTCAAKNCKLIILLSSLPLGCPSSAHFFRRKEIIARSKISWKGKPRKKNNTVMIHIKTEKIKYQPFIPFFLYHEAPSPPFFFFFPKFHSKPEMLRLVRGGVGVRLLQKCGRRGGGGGHRGAVRGGPDAGEAEVPWSSDRGSQGGRGGQPGCTGRFLLRLVAAPLAEAADADAGGGDGVWAATSRQGSRVTSGREDAELGQVLQVVL